MTWLRSLIFNISFLVIWTPLICIIFYPFTLFSTSLAYFVGKTWAKGTLFLIHIICGVTHKVEGLENIPDSSYIIASKHQSAWDTLVFFLYIKKPTYILKHELMRIPVLSLYLRKMNMIDVKRSDGSKALKSMTKRAAQRLKDGCNIIIFPEGTRTKVGESKPLQPGIAAIYNHPDINVPVVPVALNSGKFWGRESFIKKPGVITLKFLPPIKSTLHRKEFMKLLEESINVESVKLI